ncbi:MAG: phosphatase PAP2 family protein [Crocinitomicaceae bacterium]|nr:phosphatase PAP2 family protein [Crocinitomicaceae bacterium]MDG1776556.1 phosphatase PAP2 family protein [Crocinitomicaceae bacterium]
MKTDYLASIDRAIVQAVNGWNTPFLDEFMWIVSGKLTWIPFYILLIFLYTRKTTLVKGGVFFICAIISVALADQVSVHLFKEVFERSRPSHHALLTEKLHFYMFDDGSIYKGGAYGFVSSHAANFCAVVAFSYFTLKHYYTTLFIPFLFCIMLVCFSRIYLGVHYLSDVLVGGMLGVLIAKIIYHLVFRVVVRNIK